MWSILTVFVVMAAGAIDAAPKLTYGPLSKYGNYGELGLVERQPSRNIDMLTLSNGFELAKRFQGKMVAGSEKHRRGPLNNLIPGGGFGRAARSNFLRGAGENLLPGGQFGRSARNNYLRYNPFDVENKDSIDGQLAKAFIEKFPQEYSSNIDYYTPNQFKDDVE